MAKIVTLDIDQLVAALALVTSVGATGDDTSVPTEQAVREAIASLVTGPASATDAHLAVFDGATGKLIKDGGAVPAGGGASAEVDALILGVF